MEKASFNLAEIRAKLAQTQGRRYWRSLEEVAETPAFKEFLYREFPQGAAEWSDQLSRRNFLKVMGASLALAGLTACSSQPNEKILPYVRQPEELTPGQPLFYATAMPFNGYAIGALVENHEGRPTKIEGNPDHPASLGSSNVWLQAAILQLYDPDRSQVVTRFGTRISTWAAFLENFQAEIDNQRDSQGAGLRILTGLVTSPTLASQIEAVLAEFPQARWHQYEPAGAENVRAGARLAFGQDVETVYNLTNAQVILSLDANFLGEGPGHIRYARDFSDTRRVWTGQTSQSRLYVVESTPTITGAKADHRLPLRPSQIELLARAVAEALGVEAGGGAELPDQANWIAAVANDLQANRGSSLVIAGDQQPPVVHALAHAMNEALGNVGQTVSYTDPVAANPNDDAASLRELADEMEAGQVQLLIILESNPAYDAPADLQFGERIFNVATRVHLGLYEDETSELCQWHIPGLHFLEMWGDARAYDGTVSIIQPLIAPLYDGKSPYELLAAILGDTGVSNLDLVRNYWQEQNPDDDFETMWRTALHNGLMADSALPIRTVTLQANFGSAPAAGESQGLEIVFRPDPVVWDGRFANNGWLQELPRSITKLTWDNAALISPATASRLGLTSEEVVELRYRERSVHAPIMVTPGHADDTVTITLGYGRRRAGQVGNGVGFNAYALRTSDAPWLDTGLEIVKTGETHPLVTTQLHFMMEGREVVRSTSLAEYQAHPDFAQETHGEGEFISLYPEYPYEGNAWGMTIDLTSCIGCNACTIACQAENNIPVVGKDQVSRGREMHWIRVDTYFEGELDNPATHFQPVPCMHCENAPCELVCPVAATVHSAEGLNEMVYNRCVGTRYCSNNCPYKVRRFNFLQYTNLDVPVLELLMNPDVTVRQRGVMEKCTYCVQRIDLARIEAKKENRAIRDGEVVTACQQACPTQAIIFGNINDRESQVAQSKATPLNYGLLVELNTQPRTTYLAEVKNPNAELGGEIS